MQQHVQELKQNNDAAQSLKNDAKKLDVRKSQVDLNIKRLKSIELRDVRQTKYVYSLIDEQKQNISEEAVERDKRV